MKEIYRRIPKIKSNRKHCPFCNSKLQRSMQPVYEYLPYGDAEETELPLLRCYNCRVNFINQDILAEYMIFCYENDYPHRIETFECKGTKESIRQKAICDEAELKDYVDETSTIIETPSEDVFAEFKYEHNDIERKLTEDVFDILECPPSTIGIIFYEMPKHPKDTLRKAYIVLDKQDEATYQKNSYHVAHPYSKVIIECLSIKGSLFTYQEQERKLHYFYGNKKLYDMLKAYNKIDLINNATFDNLVDICVYHGKGLCSKHRMQMEMVTARVIGTRTNEPQDLQVYYCPACDEYYVNYEYYREFAIKNGIPPLRLFDNRKHRRSGGGYYSSLNAESILATYGYHVSGSLQNNPKARQRLLEDLIDMELLKKTEIVSHIEWLLRFRTDAYNAQVCWKADLDHIRKYQKNRQRLVHGVFVAGKNKTFKQN